ncbi:head GIN domain-containing protein [Georgenia thermotolerans]|uniref:Putative auto-transporter adhesin head GIN domain-containing protein n=1 Tax=Georgenia thermotolerans TaxID=527326 RepID=A0A7J5UJQ2_9MICO|nr:head GIN domain-containing protein [Georgenia thermotolerans]KAE8762635.1 hypothetical protein GB883_18345 [Georgenia thermotolerans]
MARTSAVALLAGAALLAGCSAGLGAGPAHTEERDVAGATAVVLGTSGTLRIRAGSPASLTVTAGENVIDHLTSDVRAGVLELGMSTARPLGVGDIEYRLVMPQIHAIEVNGSGDVEADAPSASTLRLAVRGSGDVAFPELRADDVQVEVSGSGGVRAGGTTTTQRVTVSGSGTYDGVALASKSATVAVSGSGTADVNVSRALDATVTGSGSVSYTGSPQVTSEVTGSGHVRPR